MHELSLAAGTAAIEGERRKRYIQVDGRVDADSGEREEEGKGDSKLAWGRRPART